MVSVHIVRCRLILLDLLDGNMLGAADEDGHIKLIDTRKAKNKSLVKGQFTLY